MYIISITWPPLFITKARGRVAQQVDRWLIGDILIIVYVIGDYRKRKIGQFPVTGKNLASRDKRFPLVLFTLLDMLGNFEPPCIDTIKMVTI